MKRVFFEKISKLVGVSNWEDWYKVSLDSIIQNGGERALQAFKYSLKSALMVLHF